MTIQEILKDAGYPTKKDNRSRDVRQINKLLKDKVVKVTVVKKGYVRRTSKDFKWNIRVYGLGESLVFYSNATTIMPYNILVCIGKFLQKDYVRPLISASVTLPCKCSKCNGTGYLPQFSYYAEGVCFDCLGAGFTSFETSVEVNAKKTDRQKLEEYSTTKINGERFTFDGLTKVKCIGLEGHKTAEHWLLEDEDYFYVGQPDCQTYVDYRFPKVEFERFKQLYNYYNYTNEI